MVQSAVAPAGFAQATDDAVYRGGYQLQDRGAAVVTGDGVQSSVINRSPGRPTRRGSLSSASGGAFDRLGDVEASQARHHIPSQRQFWDRNRCHRGLEAHAAVRQGPRPAMGREDLPLAGTEQAKADPDTRPLPDRSRIGMPSGPPSCVEGRPAPRCRPLASAGPRPHCSTLAVIGADRAGLRIYSRARAGPAVGPKRGAEWLGRVLGCRGGLGLWSRHAHQRGTDRHRWGADRVVAAAAGGGGSCARQACGWPWSPTPRRGRGRRSRRPWPGPVSRSRPPIFSPPPPSPPPT